MEFSISQVLTISKNMSLLSFPLLLKMCFVIIFSKSRNDKKFSSFPCSETEEAEIYQLCCFMRNLHLKMISEQTLKCTPGESKGKFSEPRLFLTTCLVCFKTLGVFFFPVLFLVLEKREMMQDGL